MHLSHLTGLLAAILLLQGCGKDPMEHTAGPVAGGSGVHHLIPVGSAVQTTVAGRVYDEAGQPVAGATITAGYGGANTVTDANGVFTLGPILAFERLGYVKVTKAGFFPGSRSFMPTSGTQVVRITLLAKNPAGSVAGTTGGSITGQAMTLNFTGGSFVRNGMSYSGPVNVALNRIDPSSAALRDEMPGTLLGAMDAEARMLLSFGMVAVELTDDAGDRVELAPGHTAEVRFPVGTGQLVTAPASIDLWYFNEELGYWVKEGTAALQGDTYVAQVAHFSFWNCDIPTGVVLLHGHVADQLGNGLEGAVVTVISLNLGNGDTRTSTTGDFGGYVPRDVPLTIQVVVTCAAGDNEVVYEGPIGTLSEDTTLPTITIVPDDMTMVTGTVTGCDDAPVATGYVYANGEVHFCENGQFAYMTCLGAMDITGYDQQHLTYGAPLHVVLSGDVFDAGTIPACEVVVVTGNVTDIDGNTYMTVHVGAQEWMAENLRTTRYANGASIPNVITDMEWVALTSGAWLHYGNDPQYEIPYGKLYNWYAVADPRNVCPTGWHVPDDAEWDELIQHLGGPYLAGGRLKEAGTSHWVGNNSGTNESGFTGLPGGGRYSNGSVSMGQIGYHWSATDFDLNFAYYHSLQAESDTVLHAFNSKTIGNSIRCIRD